MVEYFVKLSSFDTFKFELTLNLNTSFDFSPIQQTDINFVRELLVTFVVPQGWGAQICISVSNVSF